MFFLFRLNLPCERRTATPDPRHNFANPLFRKSKPLSLHSFLQKKIPSVAKPKFFRRFIIDETAEEKIKTPIHFSRTAFEFGNVGSAEIFIGSLLYGKRKHIIRNRRSKKMLLCFVYSKICPIFANCKQDGKNMNSYLFSLIIYRTFLNIKERDCFLSL